MSEHSVLLKYLLPTDKRSKMTDIQSDDAKLFVLTIGNDRGIHSEVPSGPHDIRPELDEAAENVQEEVNFMPVLTVKKEEAAYAHSKNDLKLQKVSVTENISVSYRHLFKKLSVPGKIVVPAVEKIEYKY